MFRYMSVGCRAGLAFLWLLATSFHAGAEWLSSTETHMGTEVSVELWAEQKQQGERAIAAVMGEMRRIESLMSPYIETSELARINRAAAKGPVKLSPELVRLIDKSLFYSRLSEGAFDISFSSLGRHYDYRAAKKPSHNQQQSLVEAIDYRALSFDKSASTLAFGKDNMAIDLGGIAKGYAVDRAIELLQGKGIQSAVVAAGGDSRMIGDRGDRPWVIGVRHPRREGEHIVSIPLADTALSTSGDYERFFEEEGVRYHHIINPSTGRSAEGVQSVSVLAPLAVDSDALSTTVFVLGVKKGLALINRLPGIDVIIIDAEGKLHYSDDLLRSE